MLDKYQRSLTATDHIACEIVWTRKVEGAGGPWNPLFQETTVTVWAQDGKRAGAIQKYRAEYPPDNPGQRILDGGHGVVSSQGVRTQYQAQVRSAVRDVQASRKSSPVPKMDVAVLLDDAMAVEGVSPGDWPQDFHQILRRGKPRLRPEPGVIDGASMQVVEADTPNGYYALWLDPERGALPRKIEVRKSGAASWRGPMGVPPPPGTITRGPASALTGATFVVDDVQIEQLGTAYITTQARIREVRTYANGEEVRVETQFRRSNIDLDPDFAAIRAFELDIPDGTPVQDFDKPGVRYEWRAGQVVPAIDQVAVDQVDRVIASGYRPPAAYTGLWLASGVVSVAVATILFVLWRRRARYS